MIKINEIFILKPGIRTDRIYQDSQKRTFQIMKPTLFSNMLLSQTTIIKRPKIDDLYLLSTLDGAIHAVDSSNYNILWTQSKLSGSLVTSHYNQDSSTIDNIDDIVYIPEPGEDGTLYYHTKINGLKVLYN